MVSPLWLLASLVVALVDSSGKYLECRVGPSVEIARENNYNYAYLRQESFVNII